MQCEICGLDYVAEYPPNARHHRRYHDEYVNGPKAKPLKSDHVLYDHDGLRITLVGPSSPGAQKNRAVKGGRRANCELRYDFGLYDGTHPPELDTHLFVAHRGDRTVGLLILDRRSHIWRASSEEPWDDYGWREGDKLPTKRELVAENASWWTVGVGWVLPKFRRQGIASKLLSVAADWAETSVQDFAWHPPFSESGKELVKRYCPETLFVGKG